MNRMHRRCPCLAVATCVLTWASLSYSQTFFTTEANLVDPPTAVSSLRRFDGESETFAVAFNSAFQGITLLDSVVLVADLSEGRIQRFSLGGTVLSPFAEIANPTFLEADGSGNVYTTQFSLGPAVATRFDPLGSVSGTFISPSAGEFAGIDADAAGNVYVATRSNTLEKFAPDGSFLSSTSVNATPLDISIDEPGQRIFLADEASSLAGIQVFDIAAGTPSYMYSIPTPDGSVIHGLRYAPELDVVFAVDSGANSGAARGYQLALDGSVLETYVPSGSDAAFDIVHRVSEPATGGLIACIAVGALLRRRYAPAALAKRLALMSNVFF